MYGSKFKDKTLNKKINNVLEFRNISVIFNECLFALRSALICNI